MRHLSEHEAESCVTVGTVEYVVVLGPDLRAHALLVFELVALLPQRVLLPAARAPTRDVT